MGRELGYGKDGNNNFAVAKEIHEGKQVDVYIGNAENGEHCHWWYNKESGKYGIKHRGQCDECSDTKESGGK